MVDYDSSTGDGIRFTSSRRQHECTAIITDAFNEEAKAVVCKVRCPLGVYWYLCLIYFNFAFLK